MTAGLVIVAIVVVLVAMMIVMSRYLIRKAVRDVVTLFRRLGATGPESGRTAQEIGLARAGMFDGMFKLRDYRPDALLMLGQAKIIKATEDGRFYLSEEDLADSQIKVSCRIK